MADVDRFYHWQLAQHFTIKQLKKLQHEARLEEHAATELDTPDQGFWQALVELYDGAIKFRFAQDCAIEAQKAKSKLLKQKAKVDYADIKRRIDILEYIGQYVELKRKGGHHEGLCPFHTEKTPSFVVRSETRTFKCYGCQIHGDIIDFQRLILERGL